MLTTFNRSYQIDFDCLHEYMRTPRAGDVSPITQGNTNELSNRTILQKFLKAVDGDGVCHVEYRFSK